jgi:hypothetical protein
MMAAAGGKISTAEKFGVKFRLPKIWREKFPPKKINCQKI